MKILFFVFCSLAISSCSGDGASPNGTMPKPPTANSNVVLQGGTISTLDRANSTAEAMAYDIDGRIIAVGTAVEAAAGAGATIIDLDGAHVLPGFQDSHVHAVEAGINENLCLLSEFGTISRYRSEITDCAADQTSATWFIGAGVSMPDLLDLTERPVDLLDGLIPNKPALVLDNLGHGAWTNSLGLAAVGFDVLAGDPQGGLIDRDSIGSPSGVVFENAQQALRTAALPPTDANKESNYEGLKLALLTLAEHGITSVSDAGGYWPRGHHEAWTRAENEGLLTVRASNAYYVFPEKDLEQQIADITALKSGGFDDLVRFDQVKIYVDGIISQGTAALEIPYTSDPGIADVGANGFEYFTQSDLFDYATGFDAAGFSLHFHATGDRGVRLALDAIEAAQSANGVSGNRHRITHLFLVDDADIPRFAELGVVADVQMTPTSIDPDTIAFYRTLIGDRADRIIPASSLLASGADVTMSSDWDADELSPLIKIEQAVLRDVQNIPDVVSAIRMMTIEPAKLLGHDDITGTIEVGKQADLVILDQDILTISPTQVDTTKVIGTIMNGSVVYDPEQMF